MLLTTNCNSEKFNKNVNNAGLPPLRGASIREYEDIKFVMENNKMEFIMRIAVVGAGNNCLYLMELIEKYDFQLISPVVVAVADINSNAPGFVKARKKGIFVSNDYNDFFKLDDIDLILELTGNLDIYEDILAKKSPRVRSMSHITARLFWEIDSAARIYSKTNRTLIETRALYDVMMNGLIHEYVIVIGIDHKILDINETFLKRLGIRRKDAIGHYCHEITHGQSEPCLGKDRICPLAEVEKTGKSATATHIHADHKGKKHYVSISCYPIAEDGELKGVVEVSKDITNEIEFQKNMMQQEKLVSIGRLSAGVAHEINNPLTTILTSSMLIQEDLDEGTELYDELSIISNEALRCRKIVKSLLDFARQTKSSKTQNDLNDIIEESLILTKKQAKFKNIDLSAELMENLPQISIDKDKIQQTIINLTLNAIESTPSGGKIQIFSKFSKDESALEFIVKDNGEGIKNNNLDKIFDPFFTTKKHGTGLGLAITHGIIEQHNGTIHVKSEPDKGTAFHITLPLNHGHEVKPDCGINHDN